LLIHITRPDATIMTTSDRRRFLKGILGALAGAAGTAVLASATPSQAAAGDPPAGPQPEKPADIQERAEQIAGAAGAAEEEVPVRAFVNGGFRNAIGGGFRNGGFANGGGAFRNGGFRNGAGGGFRNGAFRNW
jgi:rSAM-associated Gly-rich repeat protein